MNKRNRNIHREFRQDISAQEIAQINEAINNYVDENADRLEEAVCLSEDDKLTNKIGKAFIICSLFPEVFGDVNLGKFRALFIDDEEENYDDE